MELIVLLEAMLTTAACTNTFKHPEIRGKAPQETKPGNGSFSRGACRLVVGRGMVETLLQRIWDCLGGLRV